MNTINLKKLEIISNLSVVPIDKLDEISSYIKYVLFKSKTKKSNLVSIKGIWKNKGFENINVENELKNIRKEIQTNLDSIEI